MFGDCRHISVQRVHHKVRSLWCKLLLWFGATIGTTALSTAALYTQTHTTNPSFFSFPTVCSQGKLSYPGVRCPGYSKINTVHAWAFRHTVQSANRQKLGFVYAGSFVAVILGQSGLSSLHTERLFSLTELWSILVKRFEIPLAALLLLLGLYLWLPLALIGDVYSNLLQARC